MNPTFEQLVRNSFVELFQEHSQSEIRLKVAMMISSFAKTIENRAKDPSFRFRQNNQKSTVCDNVALSSTVAKYFFCLCFCYFTF